MTTITAKFTVGASLSIRVLPKVAFRCCRQFIPAMSVTRTAYSTEFPLGETCGSLTARTAEKSSNVIGRFCWAWAVALAAEMTPTTKTDARMVRVVEGIRNSTSGAVR